MCILWVGTKLDLNMMWMKPGQGNAEEMCCLSSRELRTRVGRGFAQFVSHGRWIVDTWVQSRSHFGAEADKAMVEVRHPGRIKY